MNLKKLYLRDFRNYRETLVDLGPGVNALVGPNAQGKTNLLEAIHFLITGRSFRTHHLSDLVRFGAEAFYIEALFEKNGIEHTLKVTCNGVQRKIVINSTPVPTLSALLGTLVGVILSPEDSDLVKGTPSKRRQFLDLQIAQASPLYLHHLSRYLRAMKQRNLLLRKQEFHTIEVWETEMATSAGFVTRIRQKAVEELGSQKHPFQDLDRLSLHYKSAALAAGGVVEEHLKEQYSKHRQREADQGSTLFGPHKDDLTIHVREKEARYFASEGQQRSCVSALRLAEWARLKALTGQVPLMSIDDVGISLDSSREKHLYNHLTALGQVFLTSPRSDLPLPSGARLIRVENGALV